MQQVANKSGIFNLACWHVIVSCVQDSASINDATTPPAPFRKRGQGFVAQLGLRWRAGRVWPDPMRVAV